MNPILQWVVVGIAVIASAFYAFRALAPFARRLAGRPPDRALVWLAGRGACDACGSAREAGPPRG